MVDGAGRAGGGFSFMLMLMVKVLGVPIEGSIPLFMLGVALNLFATTSGKDFYEHHRPFDAATGVINDSGTVTAAKMLFRSGSTPRESMPQAVVRDIMLTMPTTFFYVSLARAILYAARFEYRLAAVPDPAGDRRRVLP